jgi:ribbon-helix-helix CopG family protein
VVNRTLTIRLDEVQDEALTGRARALGKTRSEVVRDLIDQAISSQPVGRLAGHLKGRVALPRTATGWRRGLKERNWR